MTSLIELRQQVAAAHHRLAAAGLAPLTFGNASGIDRERGLVLIKPSGVACAQVKPEDLVAVELSTGRVVDGRLRPSSDTPTHLVLYRAFQEIGGIVHTHSVYASAWAQACRPIPCLGTTHADQFVGPIPCTRPLAPDEVAGDYEAATGRVIVETIGKAGDPLAQSAVLVANHGPFSWGRDPDEAASNAVVLEIVAQQALLTLSISPGQLPIADYLMDRHHRRKHGPDAYYGQAR
jgi:L-ribulose-5-phosphate 4-epimerase